MGTRVQAINESRGNIIKQWSAVNQGWIVWRDDSGHQSGVRVFNDEQEADFDFDNRVAFQAQVEELKFSGESFYI